MVVYFFPACSQIKNTFYNHCGKILFLNCNISLKTFHIRFLYGPGHNWIFQMYKLSSPIKCITHLWGCRRAWLRRKAGRSFGAGDWHSLRVKEPRRRECWTRVGAGPAVKGRQWVLGCRAPGTEAVTFWLAGRKVGCLNDHVQTLQSDRKRTSRRGVVWNRERHGEVL